MAISLRRTNGAVCNHFRQTCRIMYPAYSPLYFESSQLPKEEYGTGLQTRYALRILTSSLASVVHLFAVGIRVGANKSWSLRWGARYGLDSSIDGYICRDHEYR